MQSHQMAQMAAMNASNGAVDGPPMMASMAAAAAATANKRMATDPREQLNTYIYDYFLRNSHFKLARAMLDSSDTVKMSTGPPPKPSPSTARTNGVDTTDSDAADGFPQPQLPPNQMADNSFLLDWWVQFWDIYQATKTRTGPAKGTQYIQHTRNLTQMQNEQRNQRMMMNNPMSAQYQIMARNGMSNGVQANDLKRAAAMNNRPNGNPMAGMQMKNPALMAAHMQRDGSGMDMNGQRPQSPGSNENAASPNKRPRVDGGMNGGNMSGNQFGEFAQQGQNSQQKIENMNSGVQGSPMTHPGMEGQENMFAGNGQRNGIAPNGTPGGPQQGNLALQDYQMQLMLLEQQNKKRLLMARQEQDNISGPHQQGAVGAPGFTGGMSPQGNPAGPSPNPTDIKRGTPKPGQQILPGSPMPPDGMQPQRGSPASNVTFDPNQVPPGMPPQFYAQPQMPQNPMMRPPPSSHPGANFNNQPLTPQQVEAMRAGQMQNGVWRGPPQPGMMPGQQQMGGPMGQNPQQRQMPPPPAPTNDQPRPEPSPSHSNQAPPTPNQTNKPNPKKKVTKDNKKPVPKKGANTGATAPTANGEEAPTPTSSTPVAPITPVHKQSFNQNGQQQQPVQQPTPQQAIDNNGPPFGNIGDGSDAPFALDFGLDDSGALESFDFDSFLHTNTDDNGFGGLVGEFDFGSTTEVGGDL